MAREVIIIGAGGNGAVIADAITHAVQTADDPVVAGFLDDSRTVGESIGAHRVLGGLDDVPAYLAQGCSFVYTILRIDGQDKRLQLFQQLEIPDERLLTFVHPQAYVAPGVSLASGVIVMPNASISSQASLGKGCLVMVNASIGHNTQAGEFCHFAAQSCVSSFVTIERGVHIGLNATVREGLRLGAGSTLGMGAVLLQDIPEREIWAGNPARFLRKAD